MRDSPALIESRAFSVRPIPLLRPLGWLARGWRDLMRCPLPGLLHGLALALFGGLLIWLAHDRFWLLSGAFTGFLLVGPILATGLYAISRALERGEPADLAVAVKAWQPQRETGGRLMVFGLLLAFAGTGWVLTSASLITGFDARIAPRHQELGHDADDEADDESHDDAVFAHSDSPLRVELFMWCRAAPSAAVRAKFA